MTPSRREPFQRLRSTQHPQPTLRAPTVEHLSLQLFATEEDVTGCFRETPGVGGVRGGDHRPAL
jgi:hypothetical protein